MTNWEEYIVADKKILMGKPVIKRTRISGEHLINLFAQWWTEKQILENYPRLKKKHLEAVFSYIQECFQDGFLFDLPHKTA